MEAEGHCLCWRRERAMNWLASRLFMWMRPSTGTGSGIACALSVAVRETLTIWIVFRSLALSVRYLHVFWSFSNLPMILGIGSKSKVYLRVLHVWLRWVN